MTRLELYENLSKQMHETYVNKNNDYGDSVIKTYNDFGMISFATRIADKFNRFTHLVKKGEQMVRDENIEDTLIDMANYCMLAVVEMRIRKIMPSAIETATIDDTHSTSTRIGDMQSSIDTITNCKKDITIALNTNETSSINPPTIPTAQLAQEFRYNA